MNYDARRLWICQHTLVLCLFLSIKGMLLFSLGPSTTLVWLEIVDSYFPELPLWVDVESSLKNSTSHFFVFFLKQDTQQENVAKLGRVAADVICTPQCLKLSLLMTKRREHFLCRYIYIPIKSHIPLPLYMSETQGFFIQWMFVLQTSFGNVTNPALTHAFKRAPRTQIYVFEEDGKGLNSCLWWANTLTATQGYTHRMESIHKNIQLP